MPTRLLLLLLALCAPCTEAAVIFEFESGCTALLRNMDCAQFGLDDGDLVSGGFEVDSEAGSPGRISQLTADQYQLKFTFGNQSFTQNDATSVLAFNVRLDGAGFSSVLGNFTNAAGAQLRFLTVGTVNISLNGFEADTFGGSGRWRLAENSDLFSPVPLPPAGALLAMSLALVPALRRVGRRPH